MGIDVCVKRQDVLESIITVNRDYVVVDGKHVQAYHIRGVNGILSVPLEQRKVLNTTAQAPNHQIHYDVVEDAKLFFERYLVTVHIYKAPFFPDRSYRVYNYNPVKKTLALADGVSVDACDVYWDLCDDRSIEMTPVTTSTD